jgi:hypothetical protein
MRMQQPARTEAPILLGPPVEALAVGAHVVQPHLVFSPPGLRLEEHRLVQAALGTGVLLGARQRRVRHHVRVDVLDLVDVVRQLVDVDATAVGQLLVLAVPARVQQHLRREMRKVVNISKNFKMAFF